jgi:hypothetical protein
MATKKRVLVSERNGEFVVEPAVIELSGGDQLRLLNNTDEDLLWIVSNGNLFNGGAFSDNVTAHKPSNPKNPVNTANFADFAAYQVIMIKSGKKARGNSDPVIIVEN